MTVVKRSRPSGSRGCSVPAVRRPARDRARGPPDDDGVAHVDPDGEDDGQGDDEEDVEVELGAVGGVAHRAGRDVGPGEEVEERIGDRRQDDPEADDAPPVLGFARRRSRDDRPPRARLPASARAAMSLSLASRDHLHEAVHEADRLHRSAVAVEETETAGHKALPGVAARARGS